MARFVEFIKLGGPHLVLANFSCDDSNDILGFDDIRALLSVLKRVGDGPFPDLVKPGLMFVRLLYQVGIPICLKPFVNGI